MPTGEAPPVALAGLRSRLSTGIFWNFLATVFQQGSTFVVNIIAANLLSRSEFGEFTMVVSTAVLGALLASFAAGFTVTKYLAEFRYTDKARAGRVLGLCAVASTATAIVGGLLLFAGSRWLAVDVWKAPDLVPSLMLSAGILALGVMNGYQTGVLAGLESYRPLGYASLIGGAATVLVSGSLAWIGGLNGAVSGLLLGAIVRWFVFRHTMKLELTKYGIKPDYKEFRQERTIFWKFALPAALTALTIGPAPWFASTFLVRQPGGFAQMALYGASYTLTTMVLFFPRIIDRVSQSLINHQRGIGHEAGYKKMYRINLLLTFGAVIVGALGAILLGPRVLTLFGKTFRADAYPVLIFLALAAIPEGLTIATGQLLASQEKMWLNILAVNLPRDISFPLLAYFLAPLGAVGLAKAYLSSVTLAFVIMLVLALRIGLNLTESRDAPAERN